MKGKELKLKDVMCGDWVDVRKDAAPNTPHIERITPAHLLRDEHWYGIEIVPEILEKNGFKKCAGNEWSVFKYEDDDYTKKALYQVLWSANELYLEIAPYTSKTGEFNRFGVEFVHQLQHALRLCGIEKDIEL